MKYIKTYENLHLKENEKYREINIRDLYNIFISNVSYFSEYQIYKNNAFNFNSILRKIIENQKISFFGKTFNNRNFRDISGIVNYVALWSFGGSPFSMDLMLNECSENCYKDTKFDVDINIPIKIYSDNISEIEERLNIVKNMKKYNL